MHQMNGVRDPATEFDLGRSVDDGAERRLANRAVGVSGDWTARDV